MKKYGVLIGVVVFLGLAVFINARVNDTAKLTPLPSPTLQISIARDQGEQVMQQGNADYFETFRTDRQNMRELELSYLDAMIDTEQIDTETLADAQQQKLALVDNMEKEFTVESLLKAKGFSDAAVQVHAGSVNVILKAEVLTDQQVAQILDITCRETGEPAQNVKISTAK